MYYSNNTKSYKSPEVNGECRLMTDWRRRRVEVMVIVRGRMSTVKGKVMKVQQRVKRVEGRVG